MKKSENKNKLIISILTIVAIILLVSGGTYSYWSWVTANNQNINVEFVVSAPHITGTARIANHTVKGLEPTTNCNGPVYTISLETQNDTQFPANFKVDLYANPKKSLTQSAKDNLKWVINKNAANCDSPTSSGNMNAAAKMYTFNSKSAISSDGKPKTKTDTYYLHVWIDSAYSVENVGNTTNDPLQNSKITFGFKNGSIVQAAG